MRPFDPAIAAAHPGCTRPGGDGILPRMSGTPLARSALAFALAVSACGGPPVNPPDPPPVAPVERPAAPPIDLAMVDGTRVRLADHRGQIVLLTFFATWCAPCLEEMPRLNDLVTGPDAVPDLTVLAVSLDPNPKTVVPQMIEFHRLAYPVLLADEEMLRGRGPFGPLNAIPVAYLIDREGRYADAFFGITPIEHLRRRVRALAEEAR